MPVSEKIPLALRLTIIGLSILAFATGGAGHLKSCQLGTTHYNSHHQINFIITLAVFICVLMVLRIVAFDYKRRRLPSLRVQVGFDIVFLGLTFVAAISGAVSPIADDVCTGDNDMRVFIEEVCEFSCSNVIASIVVTFLMFICFLVHAMFSMGIFSIGEATTPAEDFTFDESTGTPRAHKINSQSPAQAAVGEV